jgi:lysophospholipid acyltransferase
MMVLALKLISAGVSYQDGLKKPEVAPVLASTASHSAAHACPPLNHLPARHHAGLLCVLTPKQEMSPYQQAHALTRLPSPLEWLSFIFAGGNLLAGPYFELSDYLAYTERRGPWDPRATRQPTLAQQYEAGVRMLSCPCSCGVSDSLAWDERFDRLAGLHGHARRCACMAVLAADAPLWLSTLLKVWWTLTGCDTSA